MLAALLKAHNLEAEFFGVAADFLLLLAGHGVTT
jgi:hypothetical protein